MSTILTTFVNAPSVRGHAAMCHFMRPLLVMLAFSTVVGACEAGAVPSPAALARVQVLHPGASIQQSNVGDLDGDGLEDLAYVVRFEGGEVVIGVLRGQAGGAFASWTHSKNSALYQQLPEVEIGKKVLIIHTMRRGQSFATWGDETYRLRNGELVLTNSRLYTRSPAFDDEPGPVSTETTSTDFLTGASIRIRVVGKKTRTQRSKEVPRPLEPLSAREDGW